MIIRRWTFIDLHRDCPYTRQVESGCRIAPHVTLPSVPAGCAESVTLAIGWHTLPDGRKLYEHGQSARDDDAEYKSSWRLQIVDEAIREDESR